MIIIIYLGLEPTRIVGQCWCSHLRRYFCVWASDSLCSAQRRWQIVSPINCKLRANGVLHYYWLKIAAGRTLRLHMAAWIGTGTAAIIICSNIIHCSVYYPAIKCVQLPGWCYVCCVDLLCSSAADTATTRWTATRPDSMVSTASRRPRPSQKQRSSAICYSLCCALNWSRHNVYLATCRNLIIVHHETTRRERIGIAVFHSEFILFPITGLLLYYS